MNGEELTTLFADNAELTQRFLTDLAALSQQLDASAGDVIGIADAGNAALPTLIQGEPAVVELLQQAGRLSNDVADLLEGNQDFVRASLEDGSRTLQVLYDQRGQVVPLVIGLRQYLQTLAASIRIDNGDGTLMAAVKGVLGGDLCSLLSCPGLAPSGASAAGPAPTPPLLPPELGGVLPLDPAIQQGTQDIFDIFRKVLGG